MNQYRKTPRARFLDYGTGDYFVTITTKDMLHYFGEVVDGEMLLNALGRFVERQLQLASTYNPQISVPLFVVMPNHLHAIVQLVDGKSQGREEVECKQRAPAMALRANPYDIRTVPSLSRYINSLKGAVTKFARVNGLEFAWHSRYYDHFIRNDNEGNHIADYIMQNVSRWAETGEATD